MARILITGANGFIGQHLIKSLCSRHAIFAVTRKDPPADAPAIVHWIRQDLTQSLDSSWWPKGIDTVIHLAQSKHYRLFPDQAEDIFGVNIQGTFRLLEQARMNDIRCFIFASSGGVYGFGCKEFAETDRVNLSNFYLTSKHAAELMIAHYQQFFPTIVFRFFFVYGPNQEGMLIPSLFRRIKEDQEIAVEGDPGIAINPIYVGDAIRAFEPAFGLGTSEIINVAGDEVVTITDLIRLMEQVLDKKAEVRHIQARSPGDLVGNNTRMKQLLGVTPRVSILQGLRHLAQGLEMEKARPGKK